MKTILKIAEIETMKNPKKLSKAKVLKRNIVINK